MKILFKEKQKFTQWWIWAILIGLGILAGYGIFKQIFIGELFGDNPMSNSGLILFALFILGVICFVWYVSLTTEINDDEIKIRFTPFFSKEFRWNEIKSAKIINYGFVGYGIRVGSEQGTVYNVKGNKGLAIELNSGEKIVIGTQKETELNTIVKKYMTKNSPN